MDYEDIKEKYELAKSHYKPLYEDCEEDWKFLHGEGQWDSKAESSRKKGGKPVLVLNQLMPYAQQVINDIRQARLAIRVSPVDSEADVDTAEILAGLIRNIEKCSNAQNAYMTSTMNAVGAGIGWIRLGSRYVDEQTFDQEPYIERIVDFQKVMLDPASEAIDGSDAEWAVIETTMLKEKAQEMYGEDVTSFVDMDDEDEICVLECYYKEYKADTLYRVRLPNGDVYNTYSEGISNLEEESIEYEILSERSVELPTVYYCVFGGVEEPLEKEEFPSKYIPVVPVIGQEVYMDGVREFHSLIRQAKDAQMMYNYFKSESTHILALQPKAPIIGAKGSFDSNADKWANANRESFSALEYDVVHDENGQRVEPPSRLPNIEGSQSIMFEANSARDDIRLSLGMPQANMGEAVGNVSGVAIRNKQIEGDNATFHFVDNLAMSIAQVGRILVDMIPRLYSDARIVRILGEDGQEENVPVNQPYVNGEDGYKPASKNVASDGIYDLKAGKYDVSLDVGASYSSKRQETADKLIELVRAKPELADVTADLLFEALDLPMSREIAERIRATMNPELLDDDPQAAKLKQAAALIQQMEERLMNYEAALQDKAKNEQFEQQAKTEELRQSGLKLQSEAHKTQAEIKKILAEAAKTTSEIVSAKDVSRIMQMVGELDAGVQEQRETLEIMLDAKERELNEVASEPSPDEPPTD
jgi:hypothetical protein